MSASSTGIRDLTVRRRSRSVPTQARSCGPARARRASIAVVLVVPTDPELPRLTLVAPLRCVVEDRVVGHDELQSAPRRRVRLIDVVAVPNERAEPRALSEVAGDVGARRAGVLLDDRRKRAVQRPRREGDLRHGFASLLLCLREAEVEVEVATRGRDPRNGTAHPTLVPLKVLE